jgi:hypothetical protein
MELFEEKARTVFEQTGFRRAVPETLITDYDTVMKITEFDFDLTAPGFGEYAAKRLGFQIFEVNGGQVRKAVNDHSLTEESFMASDMFRDNQQAINLKFVDNDGNPLKLRTLPDDERRSWWKIIHMTKARLQDCWEVWRNLQSEAARVAFE